MEWSGAHLPEISRLDRKLHDRSAFDSGEPALDEWLQKMAGQAAARDGAQTYVLCEDDNRVIGYYSVVAHAVDSDEAPASMRFGRYPIPAVLIARLAVDRTRQGEGIGSTLLLDALRLASVVSELVGTRILLVDALHEKAAAFYVRHGFRRFDSAPLTLYLPMQDVRRTLRELGYR